ncbi:hypothetical protein ABIA39_001123 [Nocardia sp. GAS34]
MAHLGTTTAREIAAELDPELGEVTQALITANALWTGL